jgi:hypothetical protein
MTKTSTPYYTFEYLKRQSRLISKQKICGRWVWVWANGLVTECDHRHTMHHKSNVTLTVTRHYGNRITKPLTEPPVYHVRRRPTDEYPNFSRKNDDAYMELLLPFGTRYCFGNRWGNFDTYTAHGSNVHRILPPNWRGKTRYVNTLTGAVTWK